MLTADAQGVEIFVGLTIGESEEYFQLTRLEKAFGKTPLELARFAILQEKLDRARGWPIVRQRSEGPVF